MMWKFFLLLCLAVFTAGTLGCAASAPSHNLQPAVVSHLDISRKKAYILGGKETLKIFLATAKDVKTRRKPQAQTELLTQARKYVDTYVQPIVDDVDAEKNLETRLEVAKLELLSGLLYAELAAYNEALDSLSRINRRYGKDPSFLSGSIDVNDIGFSSLNEGISSLKQTISRR